MNLRGQNCASLRISFFGLSFAVFCHASNWSRSVPSVSSRGLLLSAVLSSADADQEVQLVKVNGRWFIDLDKTIGDDPQSQQAIPMLRMMATPIINQIGQASKQVAGEINAGKFSNADDAMTAFSDKMAGIMESVLGGMMGGGGAGGFGGGAGGFGGFGPGK